MKFERKIRHRRKLVLEDELMLKYREALLLLAERQGVESLGDYLEFGVYNGTSMACMYRVIEELQFNHIRLFGFDSFEGLPENAEEDSGGHWRSGQFKSEYEFTRHVLTYEGVNWDRIFLVKGFFCDTLNDVLIQKHQISKASVIMIDCDLCSSAKEALAFCASLIGEEAIIFFDDWYPLAKKNMGEKRAFDEFLNNHPFLAAEAFGSYLPHGKIFLVSRNLASGSRL
jgi:hypothetical protein